MSSEAGKVSHKVHSIISSAEEFMLGSFIDTSMWVNVELGGSLKLFTLDYIQNVLQERKDSS